MYRTATVSVFDVLDEIFVNAVITEYDGTPGAVEPAKTVVSVHVRSTGDDDGRLWLWRALQQLQAELDQE